MGANGYNDDEGQHGDGSLRGAKSYDIQLAVEDLNFRPVELLDPVPQGRQILTAAGLDPRVGYSLFAIMRDGDFEDIRLDETVDLRKSEVAQFVAFQTDRAFKLTLNERQLSWGKPFITGSILARLAGAGPGDAVFLDVRGGTDQLVKPNDLVDLSAPGIERFITAPRLSVRFEVLINARKRTVEGPHVTFETILELAFPGVHETNAVFSMTYRHASSHPPVGELGPGGSLEVKDGTIFNVTKTVQS